MASRLCSAGCPVDRYRVGVDLVEVERVRRVVERYGSRFVDRVYTPAEQDYCRGRITSLAARWAAKEATAKSLACGIGDVGWRDIEVLNDERGAPCLRLYGAALARAQALGLTAWSISLSHTQEYAVAFVVATDEAPPAPRASS